MQLWHAKLSKDYGEQVVVTNKNKKIQKNTNTKHENECYGLWHAELSMDCGKQIQNKIENTKI